MKELDCQLPVTICVYSMNEESKKRQCEECPKANQCMTANAVFPRTHSSSDGVILRVEPHPYHMQPVLVGKVRQFYQSTRQVIAKLENQPILCNPFSLRGLGAILVYFGDRLKQFDKKCKARRLSRK